MKPASFEMSRPESLEEATRLLADNHDTARLIAGGQSLVPLLNFRLATPGILIDLNRVAGLAGIRREGAALHIKAMTRQQELIDDPLVSALRLYWPKPGVRSAISRPAAAAPSAAALPKPIRPPNFRSPR
jgi:CO/xanthine dehydrogenase FAD-binding subunit